MNATVIPVTVGGWEALQLANDHIEVVVIPAKGAEIWSVTDRRTGVDVLWKAPWALRPHALSTATAGASQTAWLDHYAGGWQVLFPNGGDAVTYQGADLGFHGEASVAPWTAAVVSQEGRIELATDLRRSPFRLHRRMELTPGASTLRFTETVTNHGTEALPYMWGHHPAYGSPFLCDGARLTVPAATYLADAGNSTPHGWPRSSDLRGRTPRHSAPALSTSASCRAPIRAPRTWDTSSISPTVGTPLRARRPVSAWPSRGLAMCSRASGSGRSFGAERITRGMAEPM